MLTSAWRTWRTARLLPLVLFAACSDGGRTVLRVYSPHGKELLEHYEKGFEKSNPDVDVQWTAMGSSEILDRVRTERQEPRADVWFGAPSELFERAAAEGLLDTLTPSWAGAVPSNAKDSGGTWYGTYLTPEVIAYNSNFVADSVAPLTWRDVATPRWKGHVVIRDPVASGTMRAIFGAIMQRSIEETGKTDSGWALLRRIDANTKSYASSPEAMYDALAKGDGWITLYNMPDIAGLARRTGAPVRYTVPTEGTPVLVDGIAFLKGSANRTFSLRFIEFVTSAEALVYAADSLHRIPVRSDIADASLPDWVATARTGIKALSLNHALMSDSLDIWMRAWDSAVRGRNDGR
ncbi:MAG TPA: extracellular solute-binding protein [Gemmatimonas sp.]|nr:extracellular solute-binding protein [Gemmatimonas sp.]